MKYLVSRLVLTTIYVNFCSSTPLGLLGFSQRYDGILKWDEKALQVWNCMGVGPACIWCFWRERNQRTFKGKELRILNLKFLFLKTLFKWATLSFTLSTFSLREFLDSQLILQLAFLSFVSFCFLHLCILHVYTFFLGR